MRGSLLTQKPDRDRIMVKLSFACADRGNDYEDDIHNMQNRKQNESDENQAENPRDDRVNEHRELEIDRFLAVCVDLGRVATFYQPNDQRRDDVTSPREEESEKCAGMTEHIPCPDIGGRDRSGRRLSRFHSANKRLPVFRERKCA
jgi:hypothetical protein